MFAIPSDLICYITFIAIFPQGTTFCHLSLPHSHCDTLAFATHSHLRHTRIATHSHLRHTRIATHSHCDTLAMASVVQLRAHLGSARLHLAAIPESMRSANSRTQAACFLETFQRAAPLSAAERLMLLQLSNLVAWDEADNIAVAEAIAPASLPRKGVGRRKMQDYEAFDSYATEMQWRMLRDPNVSIQVKLTMLLTIVILAGGRTISEGTYKKVTSMVLLLTESPERLTRMSPQEKKDCNGKTKKEFASLIRRFPSPDSHILQLPADPSEFRNRFPGMYATMYPQATHSPVACKIDRASLLHLDSSY